MIYRTEHKAKELHEELSSAKGSLEALNIELKKGKDKLSYIRISGERDIRRIESDIEDIKDKLSRMSTIFVGFIINPQLSTDEFRSKAKELVQQYNRYKLSLNSEDLISFDDISVILSVSST